MANQRNGRENGLSFDFHRLYTGNCRFNGRKWLARLVVEETLSAESWFFSASLEKIPEIENKNTRKEKREDREMEKKSAFSRYLLFFYLSCARPKRHNTNQIKKHAVTFPPWPVAYSFVDQRKQKEEEHEKRSLHRRLITRRFSIITEAASERETRIKLLLLSYALRVYSLSSCFLSSSENFLSFDQDIESVPSDRLIDWNYFSRCITSTLFVFNVCIRILTTK